MDPIQDPPDPVIMDPVVPANSKTKLHEFYSNFKKLSLKDKRLVSIGMIVVLFVALPLLVFTIITAKTSFFNRAASGEASGEPPTPFSYPTPSPIPTTSAIPTPVAQTCIMNAQTVTLTPAVLSGAPGTTLTYTLTVTNNNSLPCGPSYFDLTANANAGPGWSSSLSKQQVYLAPGAADSALLGVSSSTVTAPNAYPVQVIVKGPTNSINGTAAYLVAVSTPTPAPTPAGRPTPVQRPQRTPPPNTNVFTPSISTITLPFGRIRSAYSGTVSGSETGVDTKLSMTISYLPRGLSYGCAFNPYPATTINCTINGRPAGYGIYRIVATINDSRGRSTSRAIFLIILPF